VAAALRWFTEHAAPGGTPDLGAALERTWKELEPDAVCIVAHGAPAPKRAAARTPNATLLATADRLNPPTAAGPRGASFLCIELVEPSADNVLRTLGERHGGSTGYLLLDRESLGLVAVRNRPRPSAATKP